MTDQARRLIDDLLSTEQFEPAMQAFVGSYISDCQQKMRLAIKSGDLKTAAYECGVLETFEQLIPRMRKFASSSKRTI